MKNLQKFFEFVYTGDNDDLVSAVLSGDKKAESQFFNLFHPYIMSELKKINTGLPIEDLEEITSNTLYRAMSKLNQYNSKNLKGWIYKIMKNILNDFIRYSKIKGRDLKKSQIENLQDILHEEEKDLPIESKEKILKLRNLLKSQITPKQYQILDLFLNGYKHQEIAKIFDISVSTSKWQVSDSLSKIRKYIKNNKIEI